MSEQRCLAVAACLAACLASGHALPAWSQTQLSEELGDPMRPPQVQAAPSTEGTAPQAQAVLRLQAVKSERGRRTAVINGKVVRVGDEVDGAKITGISANSVVILVEGKSSALKLLGQDIKHDSRTTH